MEKIRKLLESPGYRYLLVGGSVFALELVIILIAQAAGASGVVAVGTSYVIGTTVSFLLQKLVTFGDKRMHHKIVIPQFIATCLLVIANFLFTLFVAHVLNNVWPVICSRTLALVITTLWNFYLYKTRIFKQVPIVD